MIQTKKLKEIETIQTYRMAAGLRGVVLGGLKAWDKIKVVALNHKIIGWKIHYLSEDDFIYLEKKK